jgi:hypothetical protein
MVNETTARRLDDAAVDLEVAAAAVPTHIDPLHASNLTFSDTALEAIRVACTNRRLLAGRLQALIETQHLGTLTIAMVRDYVVGLNEDPARLIQNDTLVIAEADVAFLIDVLDQRRRHYRGDYDKLLRRADRNSVITVKLNRRPLQSRNEYQRALRGKTETFNRHRATE